MNAVKERKYFKVTDKAFKGTLILQKYQLINLLVIFIVNILINFIQVFSGQKKNDTKKLLIICLHRLGDTVFCIPAINGIFKCYNNYEITILSYSETKSILEIRYNSNHIVTLNKNEFILNRRIAKTKITKFIKDLKPEIIFDITGNPASASLLLATGAKKIIGTNLPYFKKLYTTFIPIRRTPHYMDIYLDVLKSANPDYEDYSYEFDYRLATNGKIMILPFAIRKAKEWNLKKYVELAFRLNGKYKVGIISPPGFIDEEILNEIKSLQLDIQITNTMNELIEIIKEASIFISNDSGPLYIANLLGTPTFTIYGPTNPKFSLPFGKNHRYFQKELSCIAEQEKVCFTLGGINCPSHECMDLITVDEIENRVKKFSLDLGIIEKSEN